jgi:hypothetical protein
MFSSTRIGGTLVPSALEARSRRLQGADEEQVLGFTASTLNGQWLMLRKGQRSPSSLHNYQCGWEQPRTGKVAAARAEGGNASGRPRRRTAGQKDTSGTKQYYFTREADEPSSFSPINGEFISMAVTAGAVVGLGFGKTFCLGLCKLWFLQAKLPFVCLVCSMLRKCKFSVCYVGGWKSHCT